LPTKPSQTRTSQAPGEQRVGRDSDPVRVRLAARFGADRIVGGER
jgi:hypothetical protein